ncbi:hypothetical protein B0J18DRAFT_449918 [Chaetomium sp. MPI-SDFR-AT-0129]|nr:hypothetical protein B0J18DRAFT_449918 [Chaetomium sp. MPI-SDFR-AT-0129]
MAPTVNRPTDIKQKEADVNRKLQIYGIISAFKSGKVPSNDQIDIALNSFLESKAISSPSAKLSPEGQTLVAHTREVVTQAKLLLLSKNDGNLLQDFIWQTQQFDAKSVSTPGAPVNKEQAQQHGKQALEGLRTLGTLIITNGQFRKLLKDATILLRDMAGDAATNAATRVRPSEDQLAQLDHAAEDNTWHDAPNITKDSLKGKFQNYYKGNPKEDVKAAAAEGTSAAQPTGSTAAAPAAGQQGGANTVEGAAAAADALQSNVNENIDAETKEKARSKREEYRERTKNYFSRKVPQERRDQTVWRLKKMVLECQQHPDYYQAIQTLLDLAEEYGGHANQIARGGSGTVKDARSSLVQAETDLKTLIERFANGTSSDDLWDSINTIYKDADRDPQLRNWFKSLDQYVRRCLQEQGYILDDDSNVQWNKLYDEGNYLLRQKYRGHTNRIVDEIKFLADQFDQDPQNKAFAASLTKLFNDLGNDENGKAAFKPHLVKDLTDVILPAIFENVAYIPLPRIEYSDPQFDAIIENLVLESDNFMPNVLEIASENFLRFGRKKVASHNKHSVDVKVGGIQMDLRDVSYHIKRKQGFPSITDTGVANLLLAGDGFTFRMKLSSANKSDKQTFFKVDKVDVSVKNLNVKVVKSSHKLLFALFKPLLLKVLRPGLQKALEKAIKEQAIKWDALLYEIKQEADRALEEARESPERTPNIYNRYATAAQKKVLQGKKKAEDVVADKKVNYAITKEDSIFPDVHLPGGISSKATEYRDLARKGDKWESPVFSLGSAAKSKDIPAAPKIVRKPHQAASASGSNPQDASGAVNGVATNGVAALNGNSVNGAGLNGNGGFPHRPHNHSRTPPFSQLFTSLFNPLMDCKPTTGSTAASASHRARRPGAHSSSATTTTTSKLSYHEQRRHIIERFMARWRAETGPDFYPAMRLILPDKDRDRGVYGLKESAIGKLLVKVMKIDRNSEDGYALMHWKLPGGRGYGGGGGGGGGMKTAGDFAGRCFEIVGKRQMRSDPGEFTVADVNVMLDRLASASGEAEQLPIFEEFYQGMNAEELMWLVRVILKDMKVGATERTFLGLVSSSLRRVCWELYDPEFRLEQQETGLAQFQMTTTFAKLAANLGVSEENPEFWIEEKLDGERMQMHMQQDDSVPGGYRFTFWSRKAKEYTYLYGNGLEDNNSALTRHLKNAFDSGVRNLILDGEMITWDPEVDKIVPFGTLKTAALDQQKNPFHSGPRPLYRVFDIVLLNDKSLTEYTLADRHRALERAVRGEPRRLEIHPHISATSAEEIEPQLRSVVAEASEGLVLKNPRSRYQLNSRNNDWIKVKPEYMSEFGESLDLVVIGGYWGSGHRGGTLSTFLCAGSASTREKCLSFCKVGGGFRVEDYREMRHHTEGKWHEWDAAKPPSEYIELGGGERLHESVVISVKAAQFAPSDQFAAGWTLRFPRFRRMRLDKAWDASMDVDEMEALRKRVRREEHERRAMEMENRKRRPAKRQKKELVIAGAAGSATRTTSDGDETTAKFAAGVKGTRNAPRPAASLFQGLDFCVLSEALKPKRMTKPNLEKLIKDHGGKIHQTADKNSGMILLADKNVVKVASLKKAGGADIIRPKWVFDCLAQGDLLNPSETTGGKDEQEKEGYLLPFEPTHILHATDALTTIAETNTDQYGDSYARDVGAEELRDILAGMEIPTPPSSPGTTGGQRFDAGRFLDQLEEHGYGGGHGGGLEGLRSFLFRRCRVFFAVGSGEANYVRFGNGEVVDDLGSEGVTHVVVTTTPTDFGSEETGRTEKAVAAEVRKKASLLKTAVPRIVSAGWVEECWKEETLLDEERYAPL